MERFWLEYDRHRWRFKDLREFILWYNRIHGALWLEIGGTLSDAFIRKTSEELLFGLILSISEKNEKGGITDGFK